jgi:WhiB family redox-sensing transcriptional regulator
MAMSSQHPTPYDDPDFWASISFLPDWRTKAACLGVDPELFFPIGTTGRALDQIEEAKAVCLSCSVSEQCLQWALQTNQDAGVWGGTSEDERKSLRRRKG